MSMGDDKETTTTTKIEYTPEQKAGIAAAFPTLMQYMQNPPKMTGPSTVLPFNPLQQQAQAGAVNTAMGPLMNFSSGMMDASNWLNFGALSPDTNPWLKGTAEAAMRPITENLTQSALPNIRSQAYGDGWFGGTGQQNAEAQAVNLASRNMADTTGKIYSDAFQGGMDRMVKNLALAPQTASLGMYPWQVLEGVGGQQYARDTAYGEDMFNRDMFNQQSGYLASKDVLATLMGLGTGTSSTTTMPSPGIGGMISGGLGGMATMGGLSGLPGMSWMGGPWGMMGGAALGALGSIW